MGLHQHPGEGVVLVPPSFPLLPAFAVTVVVTVVLWDFLLAFPSQYWQSSDTEGHMNALLTPHPTALFTVSRWRFLKGQLLLPVS